MEVHLHQWACSKCVVSSASRVIDTLPSKPSNDGKPAFPTSSFSGMTPAMTKEAKKRQYQEELDRLKTSYLGTTKKQRKTISYVDRAALRRKRDKERDSPPVKSISENFTASHFALSLRPTKSMASASVEVTPQGPQDGIPSTSTANRMLHSLGWEEICC